MAETRKVNNIREKDNENEVQEEFALTCDAELKNTEGIVGGGNTLVAPFAEPASGSEAEISSQLRRKDEPIFNVMPPVKTFTGRTAELNKLHENLQKPRQPTLVSQCVAISGLGGVGKSELARKYAWEYFRFYKHIIWINCEKKFDTLKSFQKLAEDLKILKPTRDHHKEIQKDLQSILAKIYKLLAKSKTLFIFDNVDQFEDINDFLPLKLSPTDERPAIIITSRNSGWDIGEEGNVDVILLNQFTPGEAASYVKKSLEINEEDRSYDLLVFGLVRNLCWFPLALHQAVSCIKTKSSLRKAIQEYLKQFDDEGKRGNLLEWRPKDDRYTETTYTTWRVTFENIRKKERNGVLALFMVEIMSYLAPDDISLEMFIEIVKDEEKLKEAIDVLVKYSIITVRYGEASINKLVQLVVRLWLKDKPKEEEILRIALFLFYYNYFHAFNLWKYACNYTTLIDDYFCKRYNEIFYHGAFILAMGYITRDGNVLLIRKILDHLESKSGVWHKLCSEMFRLQVKCNHKDFQTIDTCHEAHVKSIFLFHAEIHKALKTSKTEDLEIFLESFDQGLINSKCDGDIALNNPVRRGNLNVVKILIENGADINLGDNFYDCSLCLALKCKHLRIAEYLLDQGANPNPHFWGEKPIHYAAMFGYVNIMQRLADTKEARESTAKKNRRPLHIAAENDQLEIVKFLISIEVDVTAMTEDGQTACHIAVEKGKIRIVKYLIDNKLVDVNLRNGKNETLLHTAATYGQLGIVKYLLNDETHVKADIKAFDDWGANPLFQAVANGKIEIVRYLIQHEVSVDNVQNETTLLGKLKSALHWAVKQVAGVDNVQNGFTLLGKLKLSPLHLAAALNNFEIAKILVEESNADINMGLDMSASPLQVAKIFNSTEVRDFLLEKGADESVENNLEIIRYIFRSCFIDGNFCFYNENVRCRVDKLLNCSESFKPCCWTSGIINFFFYHLTSDIQHQCT